jgi:alkylated DNA nucleotide flippase Atl1
MEPLQEDVIIEIPKEREKSLGTAGRMLLPCPATVEKLLEQIPEGRLITIEQIRKRLADQFEVETTCPFNTKLCLRAIANDPQRGAAYWRVVRASGELIKYFPGGVEGHAGRLQAEGFEIDTERKTPKVRGYRERLVHFVGV